MTISTRPDCEVRALAKTLLLELDDATMVAQLLVEFARTCEMIGLDRSAERFRVGADQLLDCADQLALQGI
jgi:hypothetical protein